jgi:hypothetical protein
MSRFSQLLSGNNSSVSIISLQSSYGGTTTATTTRTRLRPLLLCRTPRTRTPVASRKYEVRRKPFCSTVKPRKQRCSFSKRFDATIQNSITLTTNRRSYPTLSTAKDDDADDNEPVEEPDDGSGNWLTLIFLAITGFGGFLWKGLQWCLKLIRRTSDTAGVSNMATSGRTPTPSGGGGGEAAPPGGQPPQV